VILSRREDCDSMPIMLRSSGAAVMTALIYISTLRSHLLSLILFKDGYFGFSFG